MSATPLVQGILDGMPEPKPSEREVYEAAALMVIKCLAAVRTSFTADDVRHYLGNPPNRYATGTAFSKARGAGIIEPTGRFVRSKVKDRKYAPIQVWAPAHNKGEHQA